MYSPYHGVQISAAQYPFRIKLPFLELKLQQMQAIHYASAACNFGQKLKKIYRVNIFRYYVSLPKSLLLTKEKVFYVFFICLAANFIFKIVVSLKKGKSDNQHSSLLLE